MAASFHRTVRSLREDVSKGSLLSIVAAAAMLAVWGAWFGCANVRVVERSVHARLESSSVVHPAQSAVTGQVVLTNLVLGRRVRAGDVLVELDSRAEQLQLEDAKARLVASERELELIGNELREVELAHDEEQRMSRASIAMSRANAREAVARSKLAEGESSSIRSLREHGVMAELDELRAVTDAAARRAEVEASKHRATLTTSEVSKVEHERAAMIERLHRDLASAEGQRAQLGKLMEQLEHEIARRVVRSPVDGTIGEVFPVLEGSVLQAGAVVAKIVPPGTVHVVAQLSAATAMGRVTEGNAAQVRLAGFAWAEHGVLHATVTKVGSESHEGLVRVELCLDSESVGHIPIQHGLEGVVEVQVEEVTPLQLVLRAAGAAIAPQVASPVAADPSSSSRITADRTR